MSRPVSSYGQGFYSAASGVDPTKPLHIACSGGRSSGAMLKLLLEEHGGKLPDAWKVVFTNTGKEHPKTLEFVAAIEDNWGVPIIWLELSKIISSSRIEYIIVDRRSASRTGRPFEVLLTDKDNIPARNRRVCTQYMKVMTAKKYLADQGWEFPYGIAYGYRSDEGHRMNNALNRCGKNPKREPVPYAPLIKAGLDKAAVLAFWQDQSFDLGIQEYEGNCDLCFLKSAKKLRMAIAADPKLADWWIEHDKGVVRKGWDEAKPMYMVPGGYKALRDRILADLPETIPDEGLEDLECNCTD